MPNNDEYVEQTQTGPGAVVWIKAVAVTLVVCVIGTFPCTARAKEKVIVAIISASFYAPWYIVREKDLAQGIDLDIRIIEGIQEKNAAISAGKIQCMLNTLDTMVLARASGLPIKVIAIPAMSFGLDEMVVTKEIKSVADFPGKSYGADYGYLNHMWMLLTLKRAGIPFDALNLVTMLPQESAAGFVSGGIDIDVNYKPFSSLSLQRPGSYVLKSSFTDKTWERGLISESITCNEVWLKEKPEIAKELLRAWFEAVDWWNRHPDEGNEIIARGLDWPVADVRLTQHGAIMLTLNQNLGAFGIRDGKPVCKSLPEGAPRPSSQPSGWGKILFGQEEDCVVGYVTDTWKLFNNIYIEAGVADRRATPEDGIDISILEALDADGYTKMYSSNLWIGRVGP